MTPTINVNLQCVPHEVGKIGGGVPVLIPCPIRRSATFEVRLGNCDGACVPVTFPDHQHSRLCPARPIRVSCAIGGETWEESEVVAVSETVRTVTEGPNNFDAHWTVCRERWALVKALVLGYTAWDYIMSSALAVPLATINAMLAQRDAVFAALADMARAEDALSGAQMRAYDAIDSSGHIADSEHRRTQSKPRASAEAIAAYVEALIEQVGTLP